MSACSAPSSAASAIRETSSADYQLPDGTTRSLDSSYDHVYTNSMGDFLFTDDANFEPNVHSTQNWDRVEPLFKGFEACVQSGTLTVEWASEQYLLLEVN